MGNINTDTTPAAPAPPGYAAGISETPSQQPGLVAAAAICLTLTTIFVAIRIFTKAFVIRAVKVEDYALLLALFGLAAFVGVLVTSGVHGEGRHVWNISISDFKVIQSLLNVSQILYGPTMFAAKFSVLKQMERIFCGTKRDSVYWCIQITIWANGLFDVSMLIAFACVCIPRERLWDTTVPGTCINVVNAVIVSSVINIVSDWSALILPIIVIRRLHIDTRRKIGVTAIFALGLLACIASIVRLVYSVKLAHTTDSTWVIDPVGIWAFVEFTTVILSGCFPILPRFLQYIRYGSAERPIPRSINCTHGIDNALRLRNSHSVPMGLPVGQTDGCDGIPSPKYVEIRGHRLST